MKRIKKCGMLSNKRSGRISIAPGRVRSQGCRGSVRRMQGYQVDGPTPMVIGKEKR
jgi:hypothetical protein